MRKLPRDSIFANVFWQCAVQFFTEKFYTLPLELESTAPKPRSCALEGSCR
jgi:hypothetical protein